MFVGLVMMIICCGGLKKSLKILNNNNQIDAVNSLSIVAKIRKDKILNLRKIFYLR